MQHRARLEVIAAMTAEERGIGLAGKLPWRIPSDMAHFRETTLGGGGNENAVIMGRLTWESIPTRYRPLAGRLNIVLSERGYVEGGLPEGVLLARDLDEALYMADRACARTAFVIGGARAYAAAMRHERCDAVTLTRILSPSYAADVFMPAVDPATFEVDPAHARAFGGIHSDAGVSYEIVRYLRS